MEQREGSSTSTTYVAMGLVGLIIVAAIVLVKIIRAKPKVVARANTLQSKKEVTGFENMSFSLGVRP